MNYTPDGNYQHMKTHLWLHMKCNEFQELEPIYHDEYTALDQDRDESIGF